MKEVQLWAQAVVYGMLLMRSLEISVATRSLNQQEMAFVRIFQVSVELVFRDCYWASDVLKILLEISSGGGFCGPSRHAFYCFCPFPVYHPIAFYHFWIPFYPCHVCFCDCLLHHPCGVALTKSIRELSWNLDF